MGNINGCPCSLWRLHNTAEPSHVPREAASLSCESSAPSLAPFSPWLYKHNKKARGQGQHWLLPLLGRPWTPKELKVNPASEHLSHTPLLSPPLRGEKNPGQTENQAQPAPTSGPGHLSQAQDNQALP